MTTIKPYVPILRWRPAERKALEQLYAEDKKSITPLIEFVMPAPSKKTLKSGEKVITKTPKEKFLDALPSVAQNLQNSCGQNSIFIDVHLLGSDIRVSSFEQILSTSNKLNLSSIPVVYIIPVNSSDTDIETRRVAIRHGELTGHGLCIRIDKSHFNENDVWLNVNNFITDNKLKFENTDLLIDLGCISQDIIATDIVNKLAEIPNLKKWRSFTISGGVFPKFLTDFAPGKVHELNRCGWKLWNSIQESSLSRMPFFSDYTIQYPEYERVEAIGSASVRYTDDDKWWIFRGKKPGLVNPKTKEKGPGSEQYIYHAKTITGKSFSKFYKGAKYSFGDAEITRIAEPNNKNPGNPATWLTIGINHHITLVARQIANHVEEKAEHSSHVS
jgi:hypothetical protein